MGEYNLNTCPHIWISFSWIQKIQWHLFFVPTVVNEKSDTSNNCLVILIVVTFSMMSVQVSSVLGSFGCSDSVVE